MRKSWYLVLTMFALLVMPSVAAGQLLESRSLSLESARRILVGAEAEARRNDWVVAISIVDPSGGQIIFQRMDGVNPMPLEIALGKARTAARFRRPTKTFADQIASGNPTWLAFDEVVPLEGGLPIVVNGEVVGAIGVSGVTAQQDAQIAQAGIDALGL